MWKYLASLTHREDHLIGMRGGMHALKDAHDGGSLVCRTVGHMDLMIAKRDGVLGPERGYRNPPVIISSGGSR
jgi:hypothetical protein